MSSVNELLMLPYDEIDYTRLDDDTLYQLATQALEPFIATSALGELAQRRVPQTGAAAGAILGSPWDRYLTAYATKVMYRVDPDESIRRMRLMIPTCDDPKVLGAMIENVLSDRERFDRDDVRDLITRLVKRVQKAPAGEFTDPEDRAQFLERYGSR